MIFVGKGDGDGDGGRLIKLAAFQEKALIHALSCKLKFHNLQHNIVEFNICNLRFSSDCVRFRNNIYFIFILVPAVERVVYSTCSVHQIENEDVIKSVLPLAESYGFQLAMPFPQWPRRGLPVVEGCKFSYILVKMGGLGNGSQFLCMDCKKSGLGQPTNALLSFSFLNFINN